MQSQSEQGAGRPRFFISSIWYSLAVAVVLAATLGGMMAIQRNAMQETAHRDRIAQMKLVSGALDSAFDQAGKMAQALAETTARRDLVGRAMASRDRDMLRRVSAPVFDYIKNNAGVEIYGYHSEDLHYFLRMHRPELFDDDISAYRSMVVAANRSRQPQTGVEIGMAGIGMRGIAVINYEGRFVGTAEAGVAIEPILEMVKASANADAAVVIVPSMSGVKIDDKLPRFGDLALAVSTDSDLFTRFLKQERVSPVRDLEIGTVRLDGRDYSTSIEPLVDFSGRLVGLTIALKDDPLAASARTRTELWVTALCGGILAFLVFVVLFQFAFTRREATR